MTVFVVISHITCDGPFKSISVFKNKEDAEKEFQKQKQIIINDYCINDECNDDIKETENLYRYYLSGGEDGWVQVSIEQCDLIE